MTRGSYRGARGGLPSSQMEAKTKTVDMLGLQRMRMLGNGVMVLVHLHCTTFVKAVSK